MLSLKRTTWKQGGDVLASEKGSQLVKVFTPTVTSLDMEQFVLVTVSVYNNKSRNTRSVKTPEFPSYQDDQNPTYQNDPLKKEVNKKFAKAHSLVDKVLSCPRIKLSISRSSILDGVETGVVVAFLLNICVEKTQLLRTFTLRCSNISNSSFESECQNHRERKLVPFQNLNGISCKVCVLKVLLLMDVYGIYGKLGVCQYQK